MDCHYVANPHYKKCRQRNSRTAHDEERTAETKVDKPACCRNALVDDGGATGERVKTYNALR